MCIREAKLNSIFETGFEGANNKDFKLIGSFRAEKLKKQKKEGRGSGMKNHYNNDDDE